MKNFLRSNPHIIEGGLIFYDMRHTKSHEMTHKDSRPVQSNRTIVFRIIAFTHHYSRAVRFGVVAVVTSAPCASTMVGKGLAI